MKERRKCYDCGAYLKHRKSMARAVIEELGDNVHRIFCKSCAENGI
jgi:hypothetical protein